MTEPDPVSPGPAIEPAPRDVSRLRESWLIIAALVVITLLVYGRAGQAGFVNLDDDAYVEFQPLVNQGFRSAGIAFAFTGSHSSNWHPLTTLSHMLDCQLFGLRPAPMHWENVLWHVLNSVLVFLAWRALTGARWRSAIVAALFAVHPLHVESVAWISERKDVLSAFFWLLGILAYVHYVRQPSVKRYALVAAGLVLALLSKPMAVTFPCTLLLLDFWPLRRWPEKTWRALFIEKLPLFALVAIHSVLTFFVQRASGAANYGTRFTLGARLGNAVVSYLRYLGKSVWPESLSPLYMHPGYWAWWAIALSVIFLLGVSVLAWRVRARFPWIIIGWLWFLGTLVPVIGLIQVGSQALADRYMYVPILGVFTIIVWQGEAWLRARPQFHRVAISGAVAALLGFSIVTWRQVPVWKNSVALYQHSIAVGEDNAAIRYLLGVALAAAGRPEPEVVAQFRRAVEIQPDYVNAITQLAISAIAHQRYDEARALVERSIAYEPKNPSLRFNLGSLLVRMGRLDEAIPVFHHVLEMDPRSAGAHNELAQIYIARHQLDEARVHYAARIKLDPWNPEAELDYGTLLGNMARLEEARDHLERALWLRPDYPQAKVNLDFVNQLLAAKSASQPLTR